MSADSLDAIVVGAGPAGLNAALVLVRARRRVLVLDTGEPRNAASHAMHGYLSRDGLDPAELRRLGREELKAYTGARLLGIGAVHASPDASGFRVRLQDGSVHVARKLLLATGVIDELPEIERLAALYGTSVFHCPYCDGWEVRDRRVAVVGRGASGAKQARLLLGWSGDVVLCTNGPSELGPEVVAELAGLGIQVEARRIVRLLGANRRLTDIELVGGVLLPRDALFFHGEVRMTSTLHATLGCALTGGGRIEVDEAHRTSVPGVYAAGDAARRPGQHPASQVILAAAGGALAGIVMHQDLMQEDVGFVPALPDQRVPA